MGLPYLASREDVKSALDMAETARADAQVDRLLAAASRSVETLCHRVFPPVLATRYFSWPDPQMGRSWRFWLDANELISITTLSSGGTTITAADFFLEPQASGPPYNRIEIDLDSSSAFGGGDTPQRDITITGLFGYRDDTTPAGALAEALDTSETGVDVTDSAAIGVGNLIQCESERMIVTGKTMLSTGQTGTLTASKAAETLAVTTGSAFAVGETLLLDAERVLVVDIAGNNLVVQRAHDGSTLAAHTAVTIFAPRTLTVERGALGTTAATHSTATALTRWEPPAPVRQLTIAEAIFALQNEGAGYGRIVGSGDATRNVSMSTIKGLREQVWASHGRKSRKRRI